jgi:phosphoglycolate phosphatase-like HAD superfamily hydrolase
MIGDTPYDVEAAGKAGIPIIALRCGGWSDQDLHGAVAIYDAPAALLAAYTESPLGQASDTANTPADLAT